jgi:MFS family permease
VLVLTSLGLGLYPLLTAVTPVVWPLLLYAALAGFCGAGNDLVNFELLLGTCPKEHQPTYVGFYQTTQNLALFLMPLLGTLLADRIGIGGALLAAAALRFIGSICFFFMRVGRKYA